MKTLIQLLPLAILLASISPAQQYQVGDSSTMQIAGGSSMHDWSCDASFTGTMERAESGDSQLPTAVVIRVPVEQIECGKGVMNRKLRGALEADDHPEILFELKTAVGSSVNALTATGSVSVAGVTNSVTFEVSESKDDAGRLGYSGSVELLMTDFGIKPPTAMLGAMKTHDPVTVSFTAFMDPAN